MPQRIGMRAPGACLCSAIWRRIAYVFHCIGGAGTSAGGRREGVRNGAASTAAADGMYAESCGAFGQAGVCARDGAWRAGHWLAGWNGLCDASLHLHNGMPAWRLLALCSGAPAHIYLRELGKERCLPRNAAAGAALRGIEIEQTRWAAAWAHHAASCAAAGAFRAALHLGDGRQFLAASGMRCGRSPLLASGVEAQRVKRQALSVRWRAVSVGERQKW